jgi:hypothetical protein
MARRREIHNNSSTVIWGSFEYGGPFDHSALASPFLMLSPQNSVHLDETASAIILRDFKEVNVDMREGDTMPSENWGCSA